MYFDSLGAILHMDGHGSYVWSAYIITLIVLAMLLLAPRRRQRRTLQQLAGELRRRQGTPMAVDEES